MKKYRNKSRRKQIKKKNKTEKKIKNKTKTKKSFLNLEIIYIGHGKDGIIFEIKSNSNDNDNNDNVIKILKQGILINKDLMTALHKIDPDEKRFLHYTIPDEIWKINNILKNKYIIDHCKKYHFPIDSTNQIVLLKKLIPLLGLNKEQFRYLRNSMQLLHNNNISHGDLIDNVMMDPITNNPIIIDWENAKLNADPFDINIDVNTFSNNFKKNM